MIRKTTSFKIRFDIKEITKEFIEDFKKIVLDYKESLNQREYKQSDSFLKYIIQNNRINTCVEYYEKYLKMQIEEFKSNKSKFFYYSERYPKAFCERFAPKTLGAYII